MKNPSEKCDVFRNASSSVLYFILGLHLEEDKEVLESILLMAPSTRVKRQLPSDLEDAPDLNAPGKIPKKAVGRNFNITILAEELIFCYLSDELSDRKRIYDEEIMELSNLTRDVPIFVCAMTFPTVPFTPRL
ncbi:Lon Peptidase N-Terminal Domain And Ring Finger Protein 2 [Manis pentadactyla]|nr:Lon Peptidase N-Terminal Domain And Ring Finger Protein 2 [Manis pentadactyla]